MNRAPRTTDQQESDAIIIGRLEAATIRDKDLDREMEGDWRGASAYVWDRLPDVVRSGIKSE